MNLPELSGIGMTSRRTRERMVEGLRANGIRRLDVLEAMRSVPRHIFVEEALASRAYENTALPIGHGQTISQPYIVAIMTQLIEAKVEGKEIVAPPEEQPQQVINLMDALKASVAQAQEAGAATTTKPKKKVAASASKRKTAGRKKKTG